MADVIQLLPDNIANQIAAGEVIQRPASVVKELLENSIDADSTEIRLIVKDSGKTLIQVIDNGKGMSETDARMCFERHATSKIRVSDDLFAIRTKGFRGEALASIAAIAHVELITRISANEVATKILIDGSVIRKQEYVQASVGTNFSVKNLFFNVPARRKFLKSEPVEMRHIMEEFIRVALAHPDIQFSLNHNGNEVYHLLKGNHKQRIVSLFGKNINEKLLMVDEKTDDVNISGFITKADVAKKNSGEQYLFVNNRFIKSNYLSHAVRLAYDQLIQKDSYPTWFIYLEVDPASIDINVHPTKTEIKFDEERLIYNYIRVAVKHALGKYIMSPSLDFETDTNFVSKHSSGNVVHHHYQAQGDQKSSLLKKENIKSWENVFKDHKSSTNDEHTFSSSISTQQAGYELSLFNSVGSKDPYQIHNTYIVSPIKSGFLLIDQQYAHERILFEEFLHAITSQPRPVQKELFAETVDFTPASASLIKELLPKINNMGFEIAEFGSNTFIIHGLPVGLEPGTNPKALLEKLLIQYKDNTELQMGIDQNLARSLAVSASVKRGQMLNVMEMKQIIDKLFACDTPFHTPTGHKCFIEFNIEDLKKKFI
jgi:DNA mismatch repair protein MutL